MTWLLWGRFFILAFLLTLAIALVWVAMAERK
jgi:hypothetical protein